MRVELNMHDVDALTVTGDYSVYIILDTGLFRGVHLLCDSKADIAQLQTMADAAANQWARVMENRVADALNYAAAFLPADLHDQRQQVMEALEDAVRDEQDMGEAFARIVEKAYARAGQAS